MGRSICIVNGPGGVKCRNSYGRNNGSVFSMHKFPSAEYELNRHKLWFEFVRRYRHDFVPTQYSLLCSAHFEDNCFSANRVIAKSLNMKIKLKAGAVPTIYISGLDEHQAMLTASLCEKENVSNVI